MNTVIVFTALVAYAYGLTNPPITGPTPPAVDCEDAMCNGKSNGNHEYRRWHGDQIYLDNYFIQCTDGKAQCQACWPLSMKFSQKCNQCLYNLYDPCYTTQSWVPEKRYPCPDLCPHKGRDFSGNIEDPKQAEHYVGCWEGMTMGCVNCPAGLYFNEGWNACLYEGKYLTKPSH